MYIIYKTTFKIRTKSHFSVKDFSKISVNLFCLHVFFRDSDMLSEKPWNFTEREFLKEIVISA